MSEPVAPDLFASDEQLAELETHHAQAPQAPAAAMALAWALRQREPERSLALARAAALDDERLLPRLWLIEGERATAHGRLDEAEAWQQRAQAAFEAAGDGPGAADAALLGFTVSRNRSADPALLEPVLDRLLATAEVTGDAGRLMFIRLLAARSLVWLFGGKADERCQALLPPPGTILHVAAQAHLHSYWAMALSFRSGSATLVPQRHEHYRQFHELALASGQGSAAVAAAYSFALALSEAGDIASALEFGRAAVELARRVWPKHLSDSLWVNARLLRRLGQLSEAREMLLECLRLESGDANSRMAANTDLELGQIEMDRGDAQAALAIFERALANPGLRASARALGLVEHAHALLELQRLEEAQASLEQALAMDTQQLWTVHRVQARGLLADAWLGQGRVAEAQQAYAALMAELDAQPDFKPLASTLEGAASAYAAAGLHAEAYALGRRARASMKELHSSETEQRSRVSVAQFRTERAQLEAEHMRRLAEASAGRLAALEMSHLVLERLSTIGRELTAQLDAGRALAVLARHVRALLPQVHSLMVYLLDDAQQQLECALCEDHGQPVPAAPRALDDPDSLIARCARERQVLLLQGEAAEGVGIPLPGTVRKRSLLYAPLSLGSRLIGVMSVQSERPDAFQPETRLIFDTLCAYAAIALDNARAYQQLDAMQRRLRAQERMASMSVLVAGISHELNTPLGNAVLAVSTLRQGTQGLEQMLAEGTLRRSALQGFIGDAGQAVDLIADSLQRLSLLRGNFKEVAQDRSQLQPERVLLHELITQALHMGRLGIDSAGHELVVEANPALWLDTFAAPLTKALALALANAWQHGLAGRSGGRILVRAEAHEGDTLLIIEDNGTGMSEAVRRRAFEPFFTTRMGPHTGLGLTILHNIVADMLGGEVELQSSPGQGTRITLRLPAHLPK